MVYIVCYDICDAKRLRRVYRLMRGFGEHYQYSVFRCELTASRKIEMESLLSDEIHHEEDQVMIARLGAAGGRNAKQLESLGRALPRTERRAIIF